MYTVNTFNKSFTISDQPGFSILIAFVMHLLLSKNRQYMANSLVRLLWFEQFEVAISYSGCCYGSIHLLFCFSTVIKYLF